MKQIFAAFHKEWLLLWRDKVGLLFLFVLPMCLVLFITLTQTEDPHKPRQIHILLLNQDRGALMTQLSANLSQVKGFEIIENSSKHFYTPATAKTAVAKGKYQALILIPAGTSENMLRQLQGVASGSSANDRSQPVMPKPVIAVWVDPTLPIMLQSQIELSLHLMLAHLEKRLLHEYLAGGEMDSEMTHILLRPAVAEHASIPNQVQQNVPAWALFGMFFIITPLSGVLVKERTLGVMDRLHIAPASFASLVFGKIIAFVLLNLVQLVLMLLVGVFILPLFGFPALNVMEHLGSILAIGLCASLAAIGFGMLVGSFVRTPEQANVVGPFLIVILAAIGGIFVPIYLLPTSMQNLSVYSPMHWAHAAFIDVFVRNAGIIDLWPSLVKLLGLSLITTWLAFIKIKHRPG